MQQMPKPLTMHHVPDNYQLPREGHHTRRTGIYSEWAAIHYTVEGTDGDPNTSNWQIRWTRAVDRLRSVTLDDPLNP